MKFHIRWRRARWWLRWGHNETRLMYPMVVVTIGPEVWVLRGWTPVPADLWIP